MKTPRVYDNTFTRLVMNKTLSMVKADKADKKGGWKFEDLPLWLDNIITGATRSARGRLPANRGYLIAILSGLDEISTPNIKDTLRGRHMLRKGRPMSDQQAREYNAMARQCSDAIKYHVEKHMPEFHEEILEDLEEELWWKEQNKDVVPCVNPWGV